MTKYKITDRETILNTEAELLAYIKDNIIGPTAMKEEDLSDDFILNESHQLGEYEVIEVEPETIEDLLEDKGLTLEGILKLKTRDGGILVTESLINCWKCDYEQEDTQRFCVQCSECLT